MGCNCEEVRDRGMTLALGKPLEQVLKAIPGPARSPHIPCHLTPSRAMCGSAAGRLSNRWVLFVFGK